MRVPRLHLTIRGAEPVLDVMRPSRDSYHHRYHQIKASMEANEISRPWQDRNEPPDDTVLPDSSLAPLIKVDQAKYDLMTDSTLNCDRTHPAIDIPRPLKYLPSRPMLFPERAIG
jgi:phage/plasmid-associated DNA primase